MFYCEGSKALKLKDRGKLEKLTARGTARLMYVMFSTAAGIETHKQTCQHQCIKKH